MAQKAYKSELLGGDGDEENAYLEGIMVVSNHKGRPNADSIKQYGPGASVNKPWELRLKTARHKQEFIYYAIGVFPVEGHSGEFRLPGYTKAGGNQLNGELIWNVNIPSGIFYPASDKLDVTDK